MTDEEKKAKEHMSRTIKFAPMNDADFKAFMDISGAEHIQGQIKVGCWHSEEANEKMEKSKARILPQGIATPNHHFFNIQTIKKEHVGGLWYKVSESDGLIFVFFVHIYEEYRHRGYGTHAFCLMEDQCREMGISAINLHVFDHNHFARAMYKKLGYIGKSRNLLKNIDL